MNSTFDINANSVYPDQTGPSLIWSILFSTDTFYMAMQ